MSEAVDRYNAHTDRMRAGVIVGGAAALATVAYILWPTFSGTRTARTGWKASAELSARHGLFVLGTDF